MVKGFELFKERFSEFGESLLPLSFSGKRFISMADRNAVAFVAAGASGCAIYTDIS